MKGNDATMIQKRRWQLNGYTVFIMGLLALRLLLWFSRERELLVNRAYLWPAAIAALAVILYSRRKRLPQGYWAPLALVGWLVLINLMHGDYYFELNSRFIQGVLISFGLCYPALLLAKPENRERQFTAISTLYILLMLGIALLGLYSAVSDQWISTPLSKFYLGIQKHRLYAFGYHPNEIASSLAIALYLCIALALRSGRISVKILCFLASLVLYTCISITVTRTIMITTSVGCGVCVLLVALKHLPLRKVWLKALAGSALALTTAVLLFLCYTPVLRFISALSPQSGQENAAVSTTDTAATPAFALIQSAKAEEAKDTLNILMTKDAKEGTGQLAERVITEDLETLTNRTGIWQAGLDYIRENPMVLLTGATDAMVSKVPRNAGFTAFHMHNIWIEMLLLGGIPGFALYLLLILRILIADFRLVTARTVPLYQKFLAAATALMMVNGITEIYPGLSGNVMDMMFFVLAGAVIGFAQALKRGETEAALQTEL